MLANTMRLMASSASLQPFRNPIRTGSFMNTYIANKEAHPSKNGGTGGEESHESFSETPAGPAASLLKDANNKLVSNGGRKCASVVVTSASPNDTNRQSESETILSDPPSVNEKNKKVATAAPAAPGIGGVMGGTTPAAATNVTRGTTMMSATASKREVTTVLLQPPMKNHVVYSIDSKPKHLVEGSAL